DALMIIGSNPRLEAPVLNARIRKRWLTGKLLVGVIGAQADLTYRYNYLGAGPNAIRQFVDHKPLAKERPMFLVGQGALARNDGAAVLNLIGQAAKSLGVVKDGWNGFGVLHESASRVGALDIGFTAGQGGLNAAQMTTFGTLDLLFLLGADEIKVPDGTFVVYIGTHGDRGAHRADVILPAAAYTEKSAIYV
ncbi:molybdopterin-dependent oxidoreductase, partial [Pseudomonas sp. EA_65y_Pfl1_P113]|uniref:molybdopterin-dependent oxidoreductase n=1 Tax=Pseudomonas sp. EA_65y_Pfl1_P113 TaxID=3088692 RepID=UPI0030DD4403